MCEKDTDVTLVRHPINTIPYAQKYGNVIHVFTGQLFVSVLSKGIAQPVS